MTVREFGRNILFVVLALALVFTAQTSAYNKSWDQGHQCTNPSGGSSGWGKYDYAGAFHGGFSSKECCELLCKICPVYANTGRLQKTFTDLTVPGVGPSLVITRTYQSQELAISFFGRGWLFNLGKRLIIARNKDGDKIVGILQETGERNFFKENPDGTLELLAEYGVTYQLIKNPDGTYAIVEKDGSVQHIDAEGKPLKIFDKNGNQLTFEYNAVGCLSRITNASGNYVDFQLGPNGKIASISDNLGRTVQYSYDTNGNLTSSTDPMGNTTQYVYDSENRLTQITDPRGNTVLAVTYDSFQPARIAAFTEKGETWTITYYDGYTVKRGSAGNTWTYYFNDLGIIEKVVDPLGNVKEQHHNRVTSTSLEWEQDGNGNRTTYTYDADGNIASKTDPLGNTRQYTYVAGTNRVETETNPLGVVTKYEYDANGNLIKLIRDFGGPLQNTTTYTYNAKGNRTSVTDPLGNTTAYQYDATGNLVKITDPLGNVTTYSYDSRGNRLTETDALGHTTTYTYDLMNRLLTVTDALGNTTSYTYDAAGNRTSETNANGHTTTYTYDAWNRLIRVTDPLGNTTSYAYDSRDNRTGMTDGNAHTTTYTYDIVDRLRRETNALGGQTNYIYDAAGNVLAITDACGNATTYAYDVGNRKTTETNAAGETITYTYDALGNLLTTTLPNGNAIARAYDRLGRLTGLSDSLGSVASYTYDLAGRMLTTTDALGNTTAYTYDALGRVVQTMDPMGNSMGYAYDAVGRPITLTDREGNTIQRAYDAVGRRISERDQLGNTTTYSYDSVGNLISVADALGNTTSYGYDPLNRLVQETYADGTTRRFAYDAVGNMTSRTDQESQVTTYAYDSLNQRVSVDYPGTNDNAFTYDCAGNMLAANNADATISFTYDNVYRLTQSVQNGQTVAYAYDTASGLKTITYPSGRVVKEWRNQRGLLTAVADASDQPIVQYTYDAAGRVQTKTYANGVVGGFTNNANGWINQLVYDKGGSQIIVFQYGFDKEGNRLYARKLHDTGNSEQYVYDVKYRLVQFKIGTLDAGGNVTIPVTQTAYNLDALGNWTSKITDGVTQNRTHNNMNELVSIGGAPLAYNDNGNLTDDGTNTYDYDYENRLVKVTRKADSAVLGEYKYDAMGRRVEKHASGTATAYYHDDNRVVEERVGGATEATYAYGVEIDEVLSMERGGQTYYYHTNSLGSVVALTNTSGVISEDYHYDAYGSPNVTGSAVGNPYLFAACRFDEESSLYHYRRRMYSGNSARFLQRDPMGYADSLNLYEYVSSNPINFVDPYGAMLDEKKCNEASSSAFSSKAVKDIIDEMKKEKCKIPSVKCECCGGSAGGWFDPGSKEITMCYDKYWSKDHLETAVKHEMVHALDDCKGTKWSCDERACSEIKAYNLSGACKKGGGWRLPDETYEACVKRTAAASTAADTKCGDGTAHVNKMWSKCYTNAP